MQIIGPWTFSILITLTFVVVVDCASLSNVINIACRRNPKLKICSPTRHSTSAEDFPDSDSDPPPLPPIKRLPIRRSQGNPLLSASRLPGNLTRSEYILIKQLASQTRRFKNPFSEEDNILLDEDLIDFSSKEDEKPLLREEKAQNKGDDTGGPSWHKQEEEEPDTVLTRGGNFARGPDGEGQSRVDKYCEKYQENYAYYCADSIDKTPALKTHLLKFCPSFEANCPEKTKKKPAKKIFIPEPVAAVQEKESFPDVLNVVRAPEEIAAEEALIKLKKAHPCTPNCDPRRFKHCTAECKCDYLYPHVQRFCNPPPIPFFLNTCRLWYYSCPKYSQYHYSSQFVYSKAEKGKTIGGVAPGVAGVGTPAAAVLPGGAAAVAGANAGGIGALGLGAGAPVVAAHADLTKAVNPERAKSITSNKPNDPFETARQKFLLEQNIRPKARQADTASVNPTFGSSIHDFDQFTDRRGQVLRARSRSPFSKPGLWEPNPDDPHNRDHANKWYYRPESVGADWLSGQVTWGAHWAVPAAGVGGTDGFSAVHFPTIGNFLNIADDYD